MKFRRSLSAIEHKKIRRKAIFLTFFVVLVIVGGIRTWNYLIYEHKTVRVKVEMIQNDQFTIGGDTTNYEEFASVLKNEITELRSKYEKDNICIDLKLNTKQKTADISTIIALVNAMDVPFEIIAKTY